MLNRLGMIIVMLGAMAADSPSLLAPISLIAVGAALIWLGRRFGHDED